MRRFEEYRACSNMSFFLWVRLLTTQKLMEFHRRHLGAEMRDVRREVVARSYPEASSISLARALVDQGSSPSQALVRKEREERLREALDLPEWNIYGISYGTRVAQHYLRRYPEHTRAVILDGVVPAELALGPAIAMNAQAALEEVFTRCAGQDLCARRFPALSEQLRTLSARLVDQPLEVAMPDPLTGEPGTRTLSDRHLKVAIRLLSYAPLTTALLPLLVSEAHDGNYAPLTAQAYMIIDELERSISFPMHNSVVCTEDVPFYRDADLAGLQDTYLGNTIIDALTTVCSVWPVGQLDSDLKAPVVSDRPVLLLSGEADPVTPPSYGAQVLENLANARHLIGPGQGHGLAGVGCVPTLMRRFLEDLDPQGLDDTCLQRERPSPFFLDFTGPSP